jgi:hypothetical protein
MNERFGLFAVNDMSGARYNLALTIATSLRHAASDRDVLAIQLARDNQHRQLQFGQPPPIVWLPTHGEGPQHICPLSTIRVKFSAYLLLDLGRR